jgi:DNA-binding phage protein
MKTTRITDALKKAIEVSGKSIWQIAKESGVSHPVILRFLSGERDIRLATADKLATTLGIKVSTK